MEYSKLLESFIGFISITLMSLISYAYMNDKRNFKERQDLIENRQIKFVDEFRIELKEIKEASVEKIEMLLQNINELKVYIEKRFNEMYD